MAEAGSSLHEAEALNWILLYCTSQKTNLAGESSALRRRVPMFDREHPIDMKDRCELGLPIKHPRTEDMT